MIRFLKVSALSKWRYLPSKLETLIITQSLYQTAAWAIFRLTAGERFIENLILQIDKGNWRYIKWMSDILYSEG